MEFGLDRRAQALQGLAFPLQEEAKRALQQLKQKRINYIQLVSHDHEHSLLLLTVYSSNQGDRRLWERLQIPSDAAKTLQWSERHKTTFPYIWFGRLRFFQVQNPVVKVRPQPEFWHCVCLFVSVTSQRLDVEKETIELVHTKPTETHELPFRIPKDSPRYHFFVFKHSHQGQQQEALGQYRVWCALTWVSPQLVCYVFIITDKQRNHRWMDG